MDDAVILYKPKAYAWIMKSYQRLALIVRIGVTMSIDNGMDVYEMAL